MESAHRARPPSKRRLAILGTIGGALQLAGGLWALREGWQEVNLVIGAALVALGTPVSMAGIEAYAVGLGRRDSWALAALLGPIGPLVVSRLSPGQPPPARRGRPVRRSRVDRWVGIAVTTLALLAVGWGGWTWVHGYDWPPAPDASQLRDNERLAYERLVEIAQAQEHYRERDWDDDGQKTYAAFYIHLWQSVDRAGRPVPVGLIPRELGFAMVAPFALDGYVYTSLQHRTANRSDDGEGPTTGGAAMVPVDPAQSWAVVAEPAFPRRTGGHALLADSSGAIWVGPGGGPGRRAYPQDPEAHGWTRLHSVEELNALPQDPPPQAR